MLSTVRRLRQETQEFEVRLSDTTKAHVSERDRDQINST